MKLILHAGIKMTVPTQNVCMAALLAVAQIPVIHVHLATLFQYKAKKKCV